MIVGTIRKGFSINPCPPLSFFFISVVIFTDQSFFICLALIFVFSPLLSFLRPPPPHPQPLLQAQMLFRSPEGRVELKSLRDRLFTALMPVMPRRVAALSTRERTLVISQPRYWAFFFCYSRRKGNKTDLRGTCCCSFRSCAKPALTFVSGSPTGPATEL